MTPLVTVAPPSVWTVVRAAGDVRRQRERPRGGLGTSTRDRRRAVARAAERTTVHTEGGATVTKGVIHGDRVVAGSVSRDAEIGRGVCTTRPKHRVVRDVKNGITVEGDDTGSELTGPSVGRESDHLRLERRKEGHCERRKSTSENGSSQVHD